MTLRSSPTTSEIDQRAAQSSGPSSQPSAFDRRQVLADGIERVDVRASPQQLIRRQPLVVERHAVRGHGDQRRRAARNQDEQRLVGPNGIRERQRPASGVFARRRRQRMAADHGFERGRNLFRPRPSQFGPDDESGADRRASSTLPPQRAIAGAALPGGDDGKAAVGHFSKGRCDPLSASARSTRRRRRPQRYRPGRWPGDRVEDLRRNVSV